MADERLVVDEVRDGDEVTLRLAGHLDLATCEALRDAIGRVDPRQGTVALDMAEVTFVDSSGLVVIVQSHRRLVSQGRVLELRRVPDEVSQVLALTELADYLRVV